MIYPNWEGSSPMGNLNCLLKADDFYDYSVAEVVSFFASEGK